MRCRTTRQQMRQYDSGAGVVFRGDRGGSGRCRCEQHGAGPTCMHEVVAIFHPTAQTEGRSNGRCRRKDSFCSVPDCDTVADEIGVRRARGDAGIRNTARSNWKRPSSVFSDWPLAAAEAEVGTATCRLSNTQQCVFGGRRICVAGTSVVERHRAQMRV